jgi:hypothetical protein
MCSFRPQPGKEAPGAQHRPFTDRFVSDGLWSLPSVSKYQLSVNPLAAAGQSHGTANGRAARLGALSGCQAGAVISVMALSGKARSWEAISLLISALHCTALHCSRSVHCKICGLV